MWMARRVAPEVVKIWPSAIGRISTSFSGAGRGGEARFLGGDFSEGAEGDEGYLYSFASGQRERRSGMPRVWSGWWWVRRTVVIVRGGEGEGGWRRVERRERQAGRPWAVSMRMREGPWPMR